MPVIFKSCPACSEVNSIAVGNARVPGMLEHKCKCGTVLFQYPVTPAVEPSGTFDRSN
jgi:hypothetical protein